MEIGFNKIKNLALSLDDKKKADLAEKLLNSFDDEAVHEIVEKISTNNKQDRKAYETNLFFNHIVSTLSDGVFACDADLKYTFWNSGMEKITGRNKEEVIGTHPLETFPFLEKADLYRLYEETLAGKTCITDDHPYDIEGKKGWVHEYMAPLKNEAGDIIGIVVVVTDITEQKTLENKLRKRDKTLTKFSAQIPGVIYQYRWFPDGKSCFPFASEGIREIYEVSPDEVKNDATNAINRIHPDDLEKVIKSITESFENLTDWELEYRVKLPERGERWLKGRARPNKEEDGSVLWHGYISDITEQKKMLDANLQIKTQFQAILDTMPNEVFVKDIEGRILLANKSGADFFDLTPEEIIGKTDEDLGTPKEQAEKFNESTRKVIETAKPYFIKEGRYINKNGEEEWHQALKVPHQHPGSDKPTVLIVVTDITMRKQIEAELNETLSIVGEQNKRLLNFAHIVSHNLRNHAGNISMLLSLYDDEESDEEKQELFTHLLTASEGLNDTIKDLNEIVATQVTVDKHRKKLNLKEHFLKAKEILTTEINAHHVKIEDSIDDDLTIEYVPAYLDSILLNLLSNAIKYRHPDRQPEVTFKAYLNNGHIMVEVSDNGVGIDLDKYRDKLFGMYKTFHGNSNAKGIGLFITKNQIESMGGNIEVESEVNKGTSFKIKLL